MLSKNYLRGACFKRKCSKFQDKFLSGNRTGMAYAAGKINFLN